MYPKGKEPFAQGGMRNAYLGVYQSGPKKGKQCVIKKMRNKHVMDAMDWEADQKCSKLALELINEWNKSNIVNTKYEIIVPKILRKQENQRWKLLAYLGLILDSKDILELALSDLLNGIFDSTNEKNNNDQIATGEYVIVEDYIPGTFTKWNSNSGWTKSRDLSVQAFCHWTYHYSNKKYLFCDAQGVFDNENGIYYLTDPCILSNTIEGRVYGSTDLGKIHLFNWFWNHKCNEYCNKNWLLPTKQELDSVPAMIRKCKEKSTTHRTLDNTIIGTTKSMNVLEILQPDENPYREYFKYGVRDGFGERILFAGKVDRVRWNRFEASIIIITNQGRLIIVNETDKSFNPINSENIKLDTLRKSSKGYLFIETANNEMRFKCQENVPVEKWIEQIKNAFVKS